MTKRCLVTGATGALGPSVIRAFRDAGYDVRALVRRTHDLDALGDVEIVRGDVTDPASLARAMADVDVVVHLAALLHIVNPSPELASEYERVNVGGTRNVVDAATRANVRRIVFFSTIAVYGDTHGAVVDEMTPVAPVTFYAKTKVAAEAIVLASPVGVVVRLAAAYGPRIKGNYLALVRAVLRGRFLPIGRGRNRRTLIYEDDAGRAALLLAEHEHAPGRVFNVSDGDLHTVDAIITSIFTAAGKRKPRWFVPEALVYAGLFAAELLFRAIGKRPRIGRFTLAKYTEDVAVSSAALRTLGFVPRWTMDDGWRETVRQMRDDAR